MAINVVTVANLADDFSFDSVSIWNDSVLIGTSLPVSPPEPKKKWLFFNTNVGKITNVWNSSTLSWITIQQNTTEVYSLPAPSWRKGLSQPQTIQNGAMYMCDMFYPKLQRVEDSLIASGNLYLQFGVIKGKNYHRGRYRRNGLKWYNPYPNPFTGTGEVGGDNPPTGAVSTRTNLIPITAQNKTLSQAIPYWENYNTTMINVFNGDVSTNGIEGVTVPYLTGSGIRKNAANNLPNQFLSGGMKYKKRPKHQYSRHKNMSTSIWFCRLVIIKDKRVVQYGDISNPVIIRPNEVPFSATTLSVKSFRPEQNTPYVSPNYGLVEFKGEEMTSYNS